MQDQTVSGQVVLVRFQPAGSGLAIWLDDREEEYQLDNSELFLDGRAVSRQAVLLWLAKFMDGRPTPRATITLDPDSYVPYRRVEFRTPGG